MIEEMLTLRSSVKTPLLRFVLFRGTFLAGVGSLFLFYGGLFLPVSMLNTWGILIFCVGLGLITLGLLPYRRLRRLEMQPYQLKVDNGHFLHFLSKGRLILSIPLCAIEKTLYIEKEHLYGIGIVLKHPPPERVVVHDPSFQMVKYQRKSQKRYGCDLFIPYFSRRSYSDLVEVLQP
jgi:hypothetical protein